MGQVIGIDRTIRMNSATAFATTAAILQPLVQYGEQQDKEATVMKCGICYGANGSGAFCRRLRKVAPININLRVHFGSTWHI
jgi:hypothetical protein